MKALYNIAIFFWAISILPLTVYQYFWHKKYRGNLLFRLGLKSPQLKRARGGKRVWIHATSLGETKAVIPFLRKLKDQHEDSTIFFSCTTETGYTEASKHEELIDSLFFLPLDFSIIMKRLVGKIKPDLFVLVESDYWFNLFQQLKKRGARIALINGRLSQSSFRNYRRAKSFAKALFGMIDVLCIQNKEIEKRFLKLGIDPKKLVITGNVKFDVAALSTRADHLIFPTTARMITVASTHENEEKWICNALSDIYPATVILLAPRHPERFDKVAAMLDRTGIAYRRISDDPIENERVVLVDKIGVLGACFAHSSLAIVGGSFVEHVGGHNIYEPVRSGIPVIYGPYMHKQQSLVNILEQFGIGSQVELDDLSKAVSRILERVDAESKKIAEMKGAVEGATERSFNEIKQLY